ncbi:GntR family transcriptional regulator [Novosphingobium rosa]|uniref:GntR family transcriptional regulator n=1 Tax=Novosphingobium rosa TaxID=76978 RepID=UPI000AB4FE14|nr:GntR family transcriptional regulator [Novosphingobium rosa]
MNAGPTSARIYDALLQQLRKRGYRPGTRLDPIFLADELRTSPTPVRDALHILAGEELVTALPNGGFTTPVLDEKGLFDLYAWNADVVVAALYCQVPENSAPAPEEIKDAQNVDLADRIAAMFQWIGDGSSNIEHGKAIARINARLRPARMVENFLIEGNGHELHGMVLGFGLNMFSEMRKHVTRYTSRRKRLCGPILRHIQSSHSI